MRLPKHLTVLGKRCRIKEVPELNKHGIMGQYNPVDSSIMIDKGLRGNEQLVTVLHELFHAALHHISANQAVNPDVEEIIVDNLAKVVVENFKLNKK